MSAVVPRSHFFFAEIDHAELDSLCDGAIEKIIATFEADIVAGSRLLGRDLDVQITVDPVVELALLGTGAVALDTAAFGVPDEPFFAQRLLHDCLLYTSDAADE